MVGGLTASTIDRVLRLEIAARPEPSANAPTPHASGGLPLRLVDLGAVGIPVDTVSWGRDYSHNSKAFHRLILDSAPYLDEAEFRRVRSDWTTYVHRMASQGNNGLVVPLFLELIGFDSLPEVYRRTNIKAKHQVLRQRFRDLFAIAQAAGMTIYLATDMVPLTPPLERYLRGHGSLNATDPRLWEVYRIALNEVFERIPEVRGIMIRIGEAGPLYNRAGWQYRSEFLVGSVPGVRTMLRELLPAFESHARLLLLRTWSVGVGELGSLHTDEPTYSRALGGIRSPSLIISTKFPAGDFYLPLPVNPTLLTGEQPRIVEFQARREFEGFTAFPNFLGGLHGQALDLVRSANPKLVGTWIWTQNGGPLRAGPMSLYPLHGFWLWIDANTYVTSRLAAGDRGSAADLASEWVRRELTTDSTAVGAFRELLLRSSDAIDRGFYIRPFARKRVTFGGFELPPLLWIMEWDIPGGWSAVWSWLYTASKAEWSAAGSEGFDAVRSVDDMRQALARASPALATRTTLLRTMERSLDYERSLLVALAWYRAAMINLYRWLDTGDRAAYRRWRAAEPEFERAATAHANVFGRDLDFPAFDFSAALGSLRLADRAADVRWLARALLGLSLGLLLLGSGLAPRGLRRGPVANLARAMWLGALGPWRPADKPLPSESRMAAAWFLLGLFTLTVGMMLGFTSGWITGVVPIMLGLFALVLKAGLTGLRATNGEDATIAYALIPLLWLCLLLLAAMSIRGPLHLWYQLWVGGWIRWMIVAAGVAVPLWTVSGLVLQRMRRCTVPSGMGSVLLATGTVMLVFGILSPGTERLLSALDRPLELAPMTYAVVIGIRTYSHLPTILSILPPLTWGMVVVGALLAFGLAPKGLRRDRSAVRRVEGPVP
jgi:hypothetical protein